MFNLRISGEEFFDEETNEFSTVGDVELVLEHSLASVSKWESKFKTPFLIETPKTVEENLQYVLAMSLEPIKDLDVLKRITQANQSQINDYINSSESATTFGEMPKSPGGRGETITSELIYFWMVQFQIPFTCDMWHLNRLFSLIRICNIKNSDPKKMSRHEIAARNQALNAKRREAMNTTG